MSNLPYYPRYPRDFFEGTAGMPFELKSAYGLILDLIYMMGDRGLPDDPHFISGHLGMSVRKWNSVRKALLDCGKIDIDRGIISNKRADKEKIIQSKYRDKQRENASGSRKINSLPEPRHSHTDTDTDTKNNIGADAPKKSPREILSGVLSPAKAKAVVDHRQRIRKPLTADAAELLAKTFARTGEVGWTPDQAADEMIARGWQGIKLDWLQNSTPPKLEPATIGQSDDDWLRRLRFARMKSAWSANEWGPMPGQVGCKVPKHLLEPNDGKGWADQRPEPKRSVA